MKLTCFQLNTPFFNCDAERYQAAIISTLRISMYKIICLIIMSIFVYNSIYICIEVWIYVSLCSYYMQYMMAYTLYANVYYGWICLGGRRVLFCTDVGRVLYCASLF